MKQNAMEYHEQLTHAYLQALDRALAAISKVEKNVKADRKKRLNWGHVGDLNHIAARIEELLPEK